MLDRVLRMTDVATLRRPRRAEVARPAALVRHADGEERHVRLVGTNQGNLTLDREGRIVSVDRACAAIFETDGRELHGANIAGYLRESIVRTLAVAIESYACLGSSEPEHSFRLRNVVLLNAGVLNRRVDLVVRHVQIDEALHTSLIVHDVSDRGLHDRRPVEKLSRSHSLAKLGPVGILQLAADGSCIYVNDMWVELSGLNVDSSLGFGWIDALHLDDATETLAGMREELIGNRTCLRDVRLRSPRGEITWVRLGMTAMLIEVDRVAGSLLVITDITEKHLLLEQLHRLAYTDALTGVDNRSACLEHLDRLLEPGASGAEVAVLYIDLDGFKNVNDTMGHDHGDELLRAVAQRLRSAVRPQDKVARLGGDEFAVLMPDISDRETAAAIARHIVGVIGQPFIVWDREMRVGASVGIATGEPGSIDRATLVKQADTALYAAKRAGRSRHVFFTAEQEQSQRIRAKLVLAVQRAVEDMSFTLHYQPQVCLRSERIIGFEALLRIDPGVVLGGIETGDLIDILETKGLIGRVGRWVLDVACGQLARWRSTCEVLEDSTVSVNVNAQQLASSGFVEEVARTLERHSLPPRCLILEITESMFVSSMADGALAKLRAIGVRIALDDFGTGYASLACLGRFPLDQLKIDRSFIADVAGSDDSSSARKIVRCIVSLAHSLDVHITAEGVEDAAVLAFLAEEGCHTWQGYLCSRPLAAPRIESLLARRRRRDEVGVGGSVRSDAAPLDSSRGSASNAH